MLWDRSRRCKGTLAADEWERSVGACRVYIFNHRQSLDVLFLCFFRFSFFLASHASVLYLSLRGFCFDSLFLMWGGVFVGRGVQSRLSVIENPKVGGVVLIGLRTPYLVVVNLSLALNITIVYK
jgi:1-acyl-sn-glycerol-3-phosphate acyltransferase